MTAPEPFPFHHCNLLRRHLSWSSSCKVQGVAGPAHRPVDVQRWVGLYESGSGWYPRCRSPRRLRHVFRRHARRGDVAELDDGLLVVDKGSLLRGDVEPDPGRRVVARYTRAREIQLAEKVLRPEVVAVGTQAIPA